MTAAVLFIIGHLAFGIYFLNAGLNHFFNAKYLAGYAASKGIPFPKVSVIVSGAMLALGGISVTAWIAPIIGIALLILVLIPLTSMMHNFWTIKDAMHRATEKISFGKNAALIGGLLMVLAFIWPFTF